MDQTHDLRSPAMRSYPEKIEKSHQSKPEYQDRDDWNQCLCH